MWITIEFGFNKYCLINQFLSVLNELAVLKPAYNIVPASSKDCYDENNSINKHLATNCSLRN